MMLGRKTLFSAVTILSIFGYGVFVFAVTPTPGQDTEFSPGETLNPTNCSPGDTFCKIKAVRFPLSTDLSGGAVAKYDQGDTVLGGIPIKGIANVYSGDNLADTFLGEIFGDFSGVGGASNAMVLGYSSFAGTGPQIGLNLDYDDVDDVSQLSIRTKNSAGGDARIYMNADGIGGNIQFDFSGSDYYNFPHIAPTPGSVLGYTAANTLGWVTGAALAIGDSISGGANNQAIFTDASGNLKQSSSFSFDDSTKTFIVGDPIVTGDGTVFSLDDSTGDIQARTNGAFSAYAVSNPNPYFNVDIAGGNYLLGALGNGNQTHLSINDNNGRVFLGTYPFGNPNASYLNIDPLNGIADLIVPGGFSRIGAVDVGNGTYLAVNDGANGVYTYADQIRLINNAQTKLGLSLDMVNGLYEMGDLFDSGLGTKLTITDTAQNISGQAHGIVSFGDLSHTSNKTKFTINDITKSIGATTDGSFFVQSNFPAKIMDLDIAGGFISKIGDVTGLNNGTLLTIDDLSNGVNINAKNGVLIGDVLSTGNRLVMNLSDLNKSASLQAPLGDIYIGDPYTGFGNGTHIKVDDINQKITFYSNLGSYAFPADDGTTDYLLATDGAGQLYWQDPTLVPSDRSLKSNILPLSYGLDTLMQLSPVSYVLNSNSRAQIGFIAQDVESLVPELVGEVANGKKGLAYGQMTAVIVKSVQELDLKITDIENFATAENKTFLNNLIAWLADAANGIGDLFANRINTHELCVDGQCLNQEDVRQLIELKNQMYQGASQGYGYGYGN